jgi:hypothetical protein
MPRVRREVTPSEREAKVQLYLARRVARRLGWRVLRNANGYKIVHLGKVVSGAQYDLTVDDVLRLCIEEAHRQTRAF